VEGNYQMILIYLETNRQFKLKKLPILSITLIPF